MTKIEITKTELVWPGKYNEDGTLKEVPRVNLPFQVIERVNESKATREAGKAPKQGTLFELYEGKEGDTFEQGWHNKLIWGDNLLVMSSLLEKFAGKIDLIYIDPPFATGADFSFTTEIGDGSLEVSKEQSVLEEKAYRDTWGRGIDSYIAMIHPRLLLMKELLNEDGSILVHIGSNINHIVRKLMDEIFGLDNFRNEILVKRGTKNVQAQFNTIDALMLGYDTILLYTKSNTRRFEHLRKNLEEQRAGTWNNHWRGTDRPTMRYELFGNTPKSGQWRWSKNRTIKAVKNYEEYLKKHSKKMTIDEYYLQVLSNSGQKLDFVRLSATGKPEHYVPPSDTQLQSDIWLDIPAYERGEYPTQKSEDLLERIITWLLKEHCLVADFFSGSGTTLAVAEKLGRRWIGCDLSRWAIHVTRKRLLEIEGCKPFEVLNLGKYERKYWQGVTFSGNKEAQELAIFQYLAFMLKLYQAEPLSGTQHLHGKKGNVVVHIGAVDSPVTIDEITAALEECVALKQSELHVLGWEWEMGLAGPNNDYRKGGLMHEIAKGKGVKLILFQIPREVMEQQAVDKGDIKFFELAYLEVEIKKLKKLTVTVELKDFVIPNTELIPDEVREKIKKWSDYIDYWAIDWGFQNDTFMQGWVAYRTRKDRTLPLVSDPHAYQKPGKYRILVKVIDVFGNDTSQAYDVEVK